MIRGALFHAPRIIMTDNQYSRPPHINPRHEDAGLSYFVRMNFRECSCPVFLSTAM